MNKNGKRNCKNGVILHLRFECHISRNFYSCLWPSHSEYLKYANVNCDITISRGTMCDFHYFGLTCKCQKMYYGWLHASKIYIGMNFYLDTTQILLE